MPFTVQLTDVFVEPETAAVNCCVCPVVTVAVAGETETEIADATVTVALTDLELSAALHALTVTGARGAVAGAVYSPVLDTVPVAEFPPATPFAVQLTDVFV